jgi:hypothetical protein
MCFQRHLLRADDHLCRHSVSFEQAGSDSGSLEAKHLLPVPNRGHIDGSANLFGDARNFDRLAYRISFDLPVEGREIISSQIEIEMDQHQIRAEHEERHRKASN